MNEHIHHHDASVPGHGGPACRRLARPVSARMKALQVAAVALASVLVCSSSWSCNTNQTPDELAEFRPAQQSSSQVMPGGMPGNAGAMMDQFHASCPMVVQGSEVTVSDTDGGVALSFTTDTGDVADLRTRVQHLAQMYEMHEGRARMMWHPMGGQHMDHGGPGTGFEGTGRAAGHGPLPAASVRMVETASGAQLELQPRAALQLGALREQVRRHQQRLLSGECWLQQG